MAMAEEETRKELAAADDSQRPNDGNIFLYLLQRMDNVETNLREEIKAHREETEIGFNKLDVKIDGLEQKLEAKDTKIDRVETSLREEIKDHRGETEIGFNKLGAKIDGIHQELHSMKRLIVGATISATSVLIAVLVWLVG